VVINAPRHKKRWSKAAKPTIGFTGARIISEYTDSSMEILEIQVDGQGAR
jgi:hypothetical protein